MPPAVDNVEEDQKVIDRVTRDSQVEVNGVKSAVTTSLKSASIRRLCRSQDVETEGPIKRTRHDDRRQAEEPGLAVLPLPKFDVASHSATDMSKESCCSYSETIDQPTFWHIRHRRRDKPKEL